MNDTLLRDRQRIKHPKMDERHGVYYIPEIIEPKLPPSVTPLPRSKLRDILKESVGVFVHNHVSASQSDRSINPHEAWFLGNYDISHFASPVRVNVREPKATLLLFQTTSAMCMGARSRHCSALARMRSALTLAKHGCTAPIVFDNIRRNIMGTFYMNHTIDMERLAASFPHIHYNPESIKNISIRIAVIRPSHLPEFQLTREDQEILARKTRESRVQDFRQTHDKLMKRYFDIYYQLSKHSDVREEDLQMPVGQEFLQNFFRNRVISKQHSASGYRVEGPLKRCKRRKIQKRSTKSKPTQKQKLLKQKMELAEKINALAIKVRENEKEMKRHSVEPQRVVRSTIQVWRSGKIVLTGGVFLSDVQLIMNGMAYILAHFVKDPVPKEKRIESHNGEDYHLELWDDIPSKKRKRSSGNHVRFQNHLPPPQPEWSRGIINFDDICC